jgi:hypothetical protein
MVAMIPQAKGRVKSAIKPRIANNSQKILRSIFSDFLFKILARFPELYVLIFAGMTGGVTDDPLYRQE